MRVNRANSAARISRCAPASSTPCKSIQFERCALSGLYRAWPDHRRRATGRRAPDRSPSGTRCAGSSAISRAARARRKRSIFWSSPTRPELVTNLVINTDKRIYLLELRSTEKTYMASVFWQYPQRSTDRAAQAERGCGSRRTDRHRRRSCLHQLPLCDPGRQPGPGGRCAPSTMARRFVSNFRPASARVRCRHCS